MPRALLITIVTMMLAWINIRGIKQSSLVVNVLTVGKLLPLFLFIAVGIWFIDPTHFAAMPDVSLVAIRDGGAAPDLRLWRLRGDGHCSRRVGQSTT